MHSLKLSRCRLIPRLAVLCLAGGLWTTQARALEIVATDLYTLTNPQGVTSIHPWGYQFAAGGQMVGYGSIGSPEHRQHAIMWDSSGNAIDLHPRGPSDSVAYGTNGSQQVGRVTSGYNLAALWNGTPQSVVILDPTGLNSSAAFATDGIHQVGYVSGPTTDFQLRAALWNGTAASFVDLNPQNGFSYAIGVNGSQQVGWVDGQIAGYKQHAALWAGTAESFVDLGPVGIEASIAYGTSGSQQVGFAKGEITNGDIHAALWNGSAESYVDLNPDGAYTSYAYDSNGTYQAGWASFSPTGAFPHAMLWNGSANSVIDLHDFLPDQFGKSYAYSIDGNTIYGYAYDSTSEPYHAVKWTIVPEPASLSLLGLGAIGLLARRRNA